MGTLLFIGLLILVSVGLLIYFVPKQFGYLKTSKYLTIGYGLILLIIAFFIVFEDQLFTRSSANELVAEQGFELVDEFELVHNKTMVAMGDYYHTFTLEISERDKIKAISEIKNSNNFQSENSSIESMLYQMDNRYFGPKVTQNYETENAFIREYFEPSGRKGYAPTFRRVSISKTKK